MEAGYSTNSISSRAAKNPEEQAQTRKAPAVPAQSRRGWFNRQPTRQARHRILSSQDATSDHQEAPTMGLVSLIVVPLLAQAAAPRL
jgi:hypothetical protein